MRAECDYVVLLCSGKTRKLYPWGPLLVTLLHARTHTYVGSSVHIERLRQAVHAAARGSADFKHKLE
jgi:hypothetical protein